MCPWPFRRRSVCPALSVDREPNSQHLNFTIGISPLTAHTRLVSFHYDIPTLSICQSHPRQQCHISGFVEHAFTIPRVPDHKDCEKQFFAIHPNCARTSITDDTLPSWLTACDNGAIEDSRKIFGAIGSRRSRKADREERRRAC
jgi:hypothetical protein